MFQKAGCLLQQTERPTTRNQEHLEQKQNKYSYTLKNRNYLNTEHLQALNANRQWSCYMLQFELTSEKSVQEVVICRADRTSLNKVVKAFYSNCSRHVSDYYIDYMVYIIRLLLHYCY